MRHPTGRVLPFAPRWHVICEIDLVPLVARHEALARLCDRLEACADALPTWPNLAEAEHLCRRLTDMAEAERRDVTVERLFAREVGGDLAQAVLALIEGRRTADLLHAQDLAATLCNGPPSDGRGAAEALGYMLRCFFTTCRQTLAFETLAVLKLARRRLTAGGREMLVTSLRRRAG